MSDDPVFDLTSFLPSPTDPRIMVTLPPKARVKFEVLWSLVERLTKLLEEVREPLIGQIKLAWWRDMLTMLAADPDALPKGEPLLSELQIHWRGQAGLERIVDAAEEFLLAEGRAEREAAAQAFGGQVFHWSLQSMHGAEAALDPQAGARWGLLWGAIVMRGGDEARFLMQRAASAPAPATKAFGRHARALVMLDRVAGQISRLDGGRDYRREATILLRIGLFGR